MQKIKLFLAFSAVLITMVFVVSKTSAATAVPPPPEAQNTTGATVTEEPTPIPASEDSRAVLVATVNIYDAKIVSQDKNNIKITFDLSNREQVQPDVRYAVQLVGLDKQQQFLMDEKVYPETNNLNENQTLKKELVYLAPAYLKGEFQLWIVAKNQNGMTLSISNPGTVTLTGDNQYVEIDAASCFLKVEGEAGNKQYTLTQGVDIKPEENLIASCNIINHTKTAQSFTPQFKTYHRTTFGQEVSTDTQTPATLTFKTQEKKQLNFNLPKTQTPQAYDATLEFLNDQKQSISNKVTFHYVVRGLSATIQNLRLDKDYYQKGDTAKASFFWSASADNFPESRLGDTDNGKMLLNLAIKNKVNQSCAALQKELDSKLPTADYDLPIEADCPNPQIALTIQDDQGNILDKKEFSIESQNIPIAQKTQPIAEKGENGVIKYGIILIIALLVISIVAILIKQKRGLSILILLVLAGGIFWSGGEVKADTFTTWGIGTPAVWTVGLNKATYGTEDTMIVSASLATAGCANRGSTASLEAALDYPYSPSIDFLFYNPTHNVNIVKRGWEENYITVLYQGLLWRGSSIGTTTLSITPNYPYKAVAGSHRVNFRSSYLLASGTYSLPYEVVECTGSPIANSRACIAESPTENMPKTLVDSCGASTVDNICKFECNSNYRKIGNECLLNTVPEIPQIEGPRNCPYMEYCNFTASSTDKDGDSIKYDYTWWWYMYGKDFFLSSDYLGTGESYTIKKIFNILGTNDLYVRACDSLGCSDWSAAYSVTIAKKSCILPASLGGGEIASGTSINASNVASACSCPVSEARLCNDGVLEGSADAVYSCTTIPQSNGACGLADGKSFSAQPIDLCSLTSEPPVISGSGPWTWDCKGFCGGTTDSCRANKSIDLNWKEVNPNN